MSELLKTAFEVGSESYSISLTDWDARELAAKGFDVYSFESSEETIRALFGASKLFSDVLLYCCSPKDEEKFLRGLNPETLETAREAMKNAIANFFPVSNRSSVLSQFAAIAEAMTNPELLTQPESIS